jgi:hypothetical protein
MIKLLKYILAALLVILVALQFFGPEAPETREDNPGDLLAVEQVDAEIAGLLRNACYDCHSMETKYPWYAGIAPVSFRIYGHVEHGREELNFSEWASLKKIGKVKRLKDIEEVLEEGEMPLKDYLLLHPEGRLTDAQRASLMEWADALSREVMAK